MQTERQAAALQDYSNQQESQNQQRRRDDYEAYDFGREERLRREKQREQNKNNYYSPTSSSEEQEQLRRKKARERQEEQSQALFSQQAIQQSQQEQERQRQQQAELAKKKQQELASKEAEAQKKITEIAKQNELVLKQKAALANEEQNLKKKEAQLQNTAQELQKNQQALREQQYAKQVLEQQYEQAKKNMEAQKTKGASREELLQAGRNIEDLKKSLSENERKLQNIQANQKSEAALKSQVQELERERQALQQKEFELQAKQDGLENLRQKAKESIEQAKNDQIALERHIEQQERNIEQNKQRLKEISDQEKAINQDKEKLEQRQAAEQEKLGIINAQINQLKNSMSSNILEREKAQEAVKKLEKEHLERGQNIANLQQLKTNLATQAEQLMQNFNQIQTQAEQAQRAQEAAGKKIISAEKEHTVVAGAMMARQREADVLINNLSEIAKEREQVKASFEQKQNDLNAITEAIKESDKQKRAIAVQQKNTQDEISKASEVLKKINNEIENLKDELKSERPKEIPLKKVKDAYIVKEFEEERPLEPQGLKKVGQFKFEKKEFQETFEQEEPEAFKEEEFKEEQFADTGDPMPDIPGFFEPPKDDKPEDFPEIPNPRSEIPLLDLNNIKKINDPIQTINLKPLLDACNKFHKQSRLHKAIQEKINLFKPAITIDEKAKTDASEKIEALEPKNASLNGLSQEITKALNSGGITSDCLEILSAVKTEDYLNINTYLQTDDVKKLLNPLEKAFIKHNKDFNADTANKGKERAPIPELGNSLQESTKNILEMLNFINENNIHNKPTKLFNIETDSTYTKEKIFLTLILYMLDVITNANKLRTKWQNAALSMNSTLTPFFQNGLKENRNLYIELFCILIKKTFNQIKNPAPTVKTINKVNIESINFKTNLTEALEEMINERSSESRILEYYAWANLGLINGTKLNAKTNKYMTPDDDRLNSAIFKDAVDKIFKNKPVSGGDFKPDSELDSTLHIKLKDYIENGKNNEEPPLAYKQALLSENIIELQQDVIQKLNEVYNKLPDHIKQNSFVKQHYESFTQASLNILKDSVITSENRTPIKTVTLSTKKDFLSKTSFNLINDTDIRDIDPTINIAPLIKAIKILIKKDVAQSSNKISIKQDDIAKSWGILSSQLEQLNPAQNAKLEKQIKNISAIKNDLTSQKNEFSTTLSSIIEKAKKISEIKKNGYQNDNSLLLIPRAEFNPETLANENIKIIKDNIARINSFLGLQQKSFSDARDRVNQLESAHRTSIESKEDEDFKKMQSTATNVFAVLKQRQSMAKELAAKKAAHKKAQEQLREAHESRQKELKLDHKRRLKEFKEQKAAFEARAQRHEEDQFEAEAAARKQYEKLKARIEEENKQALEKYEATLAEFELKKQAHDKTELEKQAARGAEIEETNKINEEIKRKNLETKQAFDAKQAATKGILNQKIAEQQNVEGFIKSKARAINDLNQALADEEAYQKTLGKKADKITLELRQYKHQLDAIEEKARELTRELDLLQREQSKDEIKIKNIQEQLNQLHDQKDAAQKQVAILNQQGQAIKQKLDENAASKAKTNSLLEKEIDAYNKSTAEVTKQQDKVKKLTIKLEQQAVDLKNKQQEKSELEKSLIAGEKMLQKYKTEEAKLLQEMIVLEQINRDKAASLRTSKEQLKQTNAYLEELLQKQRDIANALIRNANDNSQNETVRYQNQKKLEEAGKQLAQKINNADKNSQDLQREQIRLNNELQRQQDAYNKKLEQVDRAATARSQAEKQANELKSKLDQQNKIVGNLQQAINKQQERFENLQADIASSEKIIKQDPSAKIKPSAKVVDNQAIKQPPAPTKSEPPRYQVSQPNYQPIRPTYQPVLNSSQRPFVIGQNPFGRNYWDR